MSSAARPELAAASACGTISGSSPRARSVARRASGTSATGRTPGVTFSLVSRGPEGVCQAIVRPPARHGATLSGWPSIRVASARTSSAVNFSPSGCRARAARMPATVAAEEEPSPRACGMRLTQRIRSPGAAVPPMSPYAERSVRAIRSSSPRPAVSSPSPLTSIDRPDPAISTSTSSCRLRASPSASKPGPRFALVAVTRTLTTYVKEAPSPARSRELQRGGGGVGVHRDRERRRRAGDRPVRVLQAVAGDRADDELPGPDEILVAGLQQAGDARRRRGLDEDALLPGEKTVG